MEKITFVTGSADKARELENYLGIVVNQQKLDFPEIQSLDLEMVAIAKAEKAYDLLGVPVLVEDTALTFSALGKLPGPFIKYFLESLQNEGLVKLLNNFESREAIATTCFALADKNGVQTFVGETLGSVVDKPRGEEGFGWDAIFIPDGYTQTWAEMTLEEKQKTSMRRKALDKIEIIFK
jgi:non-canonical purine NTP pyrophosphatase (RdgB/HAM1 family)